MTIKDLGRFWVARTGVLRVISLLILAWTALTATLAVADPNTDPGPGGPILVVTSSDPDAKFARFYTEILRTEGLNAFAVADIATVNATTLQDYDVVILPKMSLSSVQVTAFSNWVTFGGNLIAMDPDPALATLLGISPSGLTPVENGYIGIDKATIPGSGIDGRTMQYHGPASRFTEVGAQRLATLYSSSTTATQFAAVTLNSVGSSGGQAAAFAYDLATSIVFTRQGNPSWVGQERDGSTPIRSNDLFYGPAGSDPQPNWIDLSKVSIPQADEQQRFLVNLITYMALDRLPLPRFWYFPGRARSGDLNRAAVVLTGDDHGFITDGWQSRFQDLLQSSSPTCSLTNWECLRGTVYLYPDNPTDESVAAYYASQGFEVALHLTSNCLDFSESDLEQLFDSQLEAFANRYGPGVPAPETNRTHCIAWGSGWALPPLVGSAPNRSVRLDANYYFWPPGWVNDTPGHFTGSAMPMRFASLDGTLIDAYQAVTQMTDESSQSYPFTVNTLLDRALGPDEQYGVFTVNAHTDGGNDISVGPAVIASAIDRDVPLISAKQLLDWLDARGGSSFGALAWGGMALEFQIVPAPAGAGGLQALIPYISASGPLDTITRNGVTDVPFEVTTIKGIAYAAFPGLAGTYVASYEPDTVSPTVIAVFPQSGSTSVPSDTVVTAQFSEAMDVGSIGVASFVLRDASSNIVPATVSYNAAEQTAILDPSAALELGGAYTATVQGGSTGVKDLQGNSLVADYTWSFTIGSEPPPQTGVSVWPDTTVPGTPSVNNDANAVELGVKFRASVNGTVTGIRFYKGQNNTGQHIGRLWSEAGGLLASATFTGETATGWQTVSFATPVSIVANTVYVASYFAPNGGYAADYNFFATTGLTAGPLYLLSSPESGGNGVYSYGGGFPTSSSNATNYWVDIVFTSSSTGPDTTPPAVAFTSPVADSINFPTSSPVSATFNEPLDPATVSVNTFELRNSQGALVAATVNYDGTNRRAVLTPTAALAEATSYTATLKGGATDPRIKDAAGNALSGNFSWSFTTATPVNCNANPIVAENCLEGNPSSEWDIDGIGDPSIQGFATDISVNPGETISFKVDTDASNYRFDIYRLGYYNGDGARFIATVSPSATVPQNQPACDEVAATGLIDCGNWAISGSWQVPSTATSGIYLAKLVRSDTGGASHIVFVVRDDESNSDLLFQTSDTTWQAYNNYGGKSLYFPSQEQRAYKVSYNRPFNTRAVQGGQDWLFNAEYPMVRWLEANGYDVTYTTGVDGDRRGSLIQQHKAFLSVGHDEYWSADQRANVTAARDAGVHLAFFSGNEVFWKTRWEPSLGGTPFRTLVSYKDSHDGGPIDPVTWTGTWRDPRCSAPSVPGIDCALPENALTGTIFTVNDGPNGTTTMEVPESFGKLRFWRNTDIASLAPGARAVLPNGVLGYEWDEDLPNGFRPPGLIRMSETFRTGVSYVDPSNFGSTFIAGDATHALTLYKASSGALVFGAGTVQWPWGLDETHDRAGTPTDQRMKQATVNLFADMAIQPATLESGLVPASASTDTSAPSASIVAPESGATVQQGVSTTISGTATDTGGGIVAAVEVSVDGGTTWRPADGRGSWTFRWTPSAVGEVDLRVRAVDDSGNLGAPIAVSVTVSSDYVCPCTGFDPDDVPGAISLTDGQPLTLGVKFRSSVDGYIKAVRFYQSPESDGTHSARIWSGVGTPLGTATYLNDATTGWQTIEFATPIAIDANTTYVASYHSPSGYFVVTTNYFTTSLVRGPLEFLDSSSSAGNGVYVYGGAEAFPNQSVNSANYWVDVVFVTESGAPNVAPVVNNPDPQTVAEGSLLSVQIVASDAPGQVLSYTLDAAPAGMQISPTGLLTWTPADGDVPPVAESVTVRVTDDGTPALFSTVTFAVNVTNVAPTLTLSGAASIETGQTYTLGLAASDPGADTLTGWTIDWGDGSGPETVAGTATSATHVYTTATAVTISASATDEDDTYAAGNTVAVTVSAANVAPVVNNPDPQTVAEGSLLSVQIVASDAPGQVLSYTLDAAPAGMQISPTGLLTWTPADGDVPPVAESVTVRVTDDGTPALFSTVTFAVNVTNVAPTLTLSGAASIETGQTYTLGLAASDPGADTLTGWTIDWGDGSGPETVAGTATSATHVYTTATAVTISASATDEDDTYAAGNTVAVTVSAANVAPVVNNPDPQTVAEGSLLSVQIVASDAPGQVLSYTLDAAPAGMQISPTGLLTWTPADGDVPPVAESVTVRVTDDGTPALFSTVTFAVNVTNVAPTLTLSGAASIETGQTYTLGLAASDPGADTLTGWTIDWGDGSGPETVAGTATSATHVYTTATAVTISASATDEDDTYAAGNTVAVTVSAANVAPVVNNPDPQTVAEGSLLSVQIVASDAPGQVLSYTLDAAPAGMQISPTGLLTWTPADGDVPPVAESVTVRVTDDGTPALFSTVTFAVNVTNVAPTLTLSGAASIETGQTYTLGLAASDPGADTLTGWTIDWGDGSGPETVAGTATSATHVYTTATAVTISASATDEDDTYAAGNTVAVTVSAANVAPVVNNPDPQTVAEGSLLSVQIVASDAPGQVLSYTLDAAPAGMQISPTGLLTWTPADGDVPPVAESVTVRVTDDGTPALFSTVTFAVNVTNVAPTLTLSGAASIETGQTYTLGLAASDPGADTLTGWTIDWGDGSGPETVAGTATSATHVYTTATAVTISASATDEDDTYAAGNTVAVTVSAANVAPVVNNPDPQTVAEGSLLSVQIVASDAPGQVLSYTLDAAPAGMQISPTGLLTWTPADGDVPPVAESVTVRVTDDGTPALFSTVTFAVNVTNVAPTLTLSGAASIETGQTYTLGLAASDPGADTLTGWTIDWGDGSGPETVAGTATSATHVYTTATAVTISASATDEDDTYAAGNTVAVTVSAANVAPVVNNPDPQTVAEGSLLSVQIVASDAPGQVLSYTLDAAPAGMQISPTGLLTWTPADGDVPPVAESVTVRVTDDGTPALFSTVTFAVNVTNVAPTLTLSGAASIETGQTYTLGLAASDPGADTLTGWTIDWGDGSGPETVAGTATSATHVYTTATAVTISASATDEDDTYAAGNTVAVTVSAANVAPVVNNPDPQTVAEGSLLSVQIVASDAPGQVLSYTLDAAPAGMQISPTGLLTWTPADGDVPPVAESVTVRVTDDGTPALFSTVTFAVNVTNVAPTLTLSGAASIETGQTYTLGLAASDPGADTLTGWTIDWGDGSGPETVAGTATSATHVYTTATAVTISASATDEDDTYAAGNTVAVTVSAANVAPVVNNPDPQTVAEGSLLSVQIVASDAPGQVLSYTLDAAPAGMQISPTGLLTWTPADGDVPPVAESVTVRVTDDGTPALFSTVTFAVNVTNVAPTLTLSGAASIETGQTYTLGLAASDPGADTLTGWTIDWGDGSGPETVAGTATSATHVYTTATAVTISASATDEDDTYAAGNTVAVTVSAANVAPVVNNPDPQTVAEGSLLSVQIVASDAPGQVLSYTLDAAPAGMQISPTGLLTWTPADGDVPPVAESVTVRVTDDGTPALFSTVTFAVNVTNVAPTLTLSGAASIETGQTYTLGLAASDPGADTLTGWTIDWGDGSGPETVAGTATSATHVYTTATAVTISASATDEDDTYAAGNTVAVTVSAANVAPVVNNPDPQTVAEGSLLSVQIVASDAPGQVLSYTLDAAPAGMQISPTGLLTWTPADGDVPPVAESVTVRVTDDGTPALFSTVTFAVNVTNVAPTLTLSGAASIETGQTYTLGLAASDPGADTLTGWTIDWGDGSGPETVAGTATSATHVYTMVGNYLISANATDEDGTYQANDLSVSINTPPILINPGDKESTLRAPVELQIVATDPDPGATLNFTASGLPQGLGINSATGLISGRPSKTGNYNVTVSVSDLRGGTASVSFTWFITRKATTPRPIVTLTSNPSSVSPGESVNLTWTSTNATSCQATDGWSGTKSLNGSEQSGTLSAATRFTLTCTGLGGSATSSVDVAVSDETGNNPPDLTNPGPQDSQVGQSVTVTLIASDPDGDPLTFSAAGLPPNVAIDPSTGVISGTVVASGAWVVTLEVSDGRGGLDQEVFNWTVAGATNSPPTVVNPGDQSSKLGDTISLQIQAADIDGDTLSYAAVGLPAGLSINAGGAITGAIGSPGKSTVTVTVTDSKGAATSVTFRWSVARK